MPTTTIFEAIRDDHQVQRTLVEHDFYVPLGTEASLGAEYFDEMERGRAQ